jgi:hypothetical protein
VRAEVRGAVKWQRGCASTTYRMALGHVLSLTFALIMVAAWADGRQGTWPLTYADGGHLSRT